MIEYFLKNDKKSIRPCITNLIHELESFFKLENINLEKSPKSYYPELNSLLGDRELLKINDLYYTIEKNQNQFPFLKNYINKETSNKDKPFRFVETFAGCGGLSIGLENAGFNPTFVNEIDSTYCETFYFNHTLPIEQYFVGDIHKLIENSNQYSDYLIDLDLVTGGPPCQGFSMANRQRILDDPRNHLYKAYLEFLALTKPKFFLMENVKGMSNKIEDVLADFHYFLGEKYNIHYGLFNARDFGVPQNRERFFIIGNRIGVNTENIFKAIKSEKHEKFVLKDALHSLPTLKPKSIKNKNTIENEDFGFTIRLNDNNEISVYENFINNKTQTRYVFNHKNRFNNKRDIEIYTKLPQGANSLHPSIKDIMPYTSRNHIFKDKFYKLNENEPCKTITSHMKFDCNMYIHPWQSRGLSSREAARIQTFPDNFYLRGSQNKWYAQVGNAVPVKLAEVIGKHIIQYLK